MPLPLKAVLFQTTTDIAKTGLHCQPHWIYNHTLKKHTHKVCVSGFWNGSMAEKRVTLNVPAAVQSDAGREKPGKKNPVECCAQDSPLSSPWPIIIETALTITLSHRSSLKQ